jgi:hypothetical protein
MSTDRSKWRFNWLSCIAQLTSIDLQRTSWLDARNQNPHWSFVEFNCCYFDDCRLSEGYSKLINDSFVTQEEYLVLHDWHRDLDKYNAPTNDQRDHEKILSDSRWLRVVEIGNAARQQLESILTNDEKSILLNAMKYPGPSQWP